MMVTLLSIPNTLFNNLAVSNNDAVWMDSILLLIANSFSFFKTVSSVMTMTGTTVTFVLQLPRVTRKVNILTYLFTFFLPKHRNLAGYLYLRLLLGWIE